MHPLIRYDADESPTEFTSYTHSRRPPAKKRKRNHRNSQKSQSAPARGALQHWDDPGSDAVHVVYDEQEDSEAATVSLGDGSLAVSCADDVERDEEVCGEGAAAERDDVVDVGVEQDGVEEEEEEESRELTHAEIWDDTALIDAWNSAEAEYEAYHGTSKSWKTEPVKKSPLWYNKPYTAPTPQSSSNKSMICSKQLQHQEQEDGELEPDTAPLDFHSFVPTHDPSLALPSNTGTNPAGAAPFVVPPPSTVTVSRDEAFNNALSAMYWGGYWTAVYHCQTQSGGRDNNTTVGATEENGIEASEDEEDLVPTQR